VKHWWTGVKGFSFAPGQEPPTVPSGFHVLPKRWIVERTFAWFGHYRRLSKDYEWSPATSETFIQLAMIHYNDSTYRTAQTQESEIARPPAFQKASKLYTNYSLGIHGLCLPRWHKQQLVASMAFCCLA
jgi:hypothetical protein